MRVKARRKSLERERADLVSAAEDGVASTSTLAVEPVNNDVKTKVYLKPPMSGQLLIAIAVRNLDPRGGQVSSF